jgi:hypothetical protein
MAEEAVHLMVARKQEGTGLELQASSFFHFCPTCPLSPGYWLVPPIRAGVLLSVVLCVNLVWKCPHKPFDLLISWNS